jgi:hypothetical protein
MMTFDGSPLHQRGWAAAAHVGCGGERSPRRDALTQRGAPSSRMVSGLAGKAVAQTINSEEQDAGEADSFRLSRRRRWAAVPPVSTRSRSASRRRDRIPESHRRARESDSVPAERLPRSAVCGDGRVRLVALLAVAFAAVAALPAGATASDTNGKIVYGSVFPNYGVTINPDGSDPHQVGPIDSTTCIT